MSGQATVLDFKDDTIPDELPEAPELSCEVCGKELTYAGRGRKPRYCDEHKKGTSSPATKRAGNGSVEQAVSTLDGMYTMLAAALLMVNLTESATNLSASREYLTTQNRAFLAKDPALVKSINKLGTAGGRVGFFAVQAMVLGPVLVTAAGELRARRAPRETGDAPFAAFAGDSE